MYPAVFVVKNQEIQRQIKEIKEQIRFVKEKGFEYGLLKQNSDVLDAEYKLIRFNYLGNFDDSLKELLFEVKNISYSVDTFKENGLTCPLEINVVVVNQCLQINMIYRDDYFEEKEIETWMNHYKDTLETLVNTCMANETVDFTPSDFKGLNMTIDQLDELFE